MNLDLLKRKIIAASLDDEDMKEALSFVLPKHRNESAGSWWFTCVRRCSTGCAPSCTAVNCSNASCMGGACTSSATSR